MKPADVMRSIFPEHQEWSNTTLEIADRIDHIDIRSSEPIMPVYELPQGETPEGLLIKLALEGLEKRYPKGSSKRQEAEERLEYEIEIIKGMRFVEYFLVIWDIYREARRRGIACGLGRGSAAGSVLSYCLGITDIDPLEYGLLFERFLNPGRAKEVRLDFPERPITSWRETCKT
jgi:DNA polymerase-3 subunit alpha